MRVANTPARKRPSVHVIVGKSVRSQTVDLEQNAMMPPTYPKRQVFLIPIRQARVVEPLHIRLRSWLTTHRLLLYAIGILLLIGWEQSHPLPTNITRAEYERALARWQSLGVEEYIISTETHAFLGGDLTLRVFEHGNKIEQLAPRYRPLSALDEGDFKYLRRYTVEGIFEQIEDVFNEQDDPIQRAGMAVGSLDFYMVYQISFDPVLGYPTRFSAQPMPPGHIFDADWDERVTSLTILKLGK